MLVAALMVGTATVNAQIWGGQLILRGGFAANNFKGDNTRGIDMLPGKRFRGSCNPVQQCEFDNQFRFEVQTRQGRQELLHGRISCQKIYGREHRKGRRHHPRYRERRHHVAGAPYQFPHSRDSRAVTSRHGRQGHRQHGFPAVP